MKLKPAQVSFISFKPKSKPKNYETIMFMIASWP